MNERGRAVRTSRPTTTGNGAGAVAPARSAAQRPASRHRYAVITVHAPVQQPVDSVARERAADTRGDDGPQARTPHVAVEPAGHLPMLVRRALADEPGTTLESLPHVRLHVSRSTMLAARALGADAFTVGRHVMFGVGGVQSGAPSGHRLLAHEAVHVEQQAQARRAAIDCKPAASPPDPYRALRQAIADQAKQRYPGILGHLATLQRLQELADSIEAHDLPAVKTAVKAFIVRDSEHPLDPATAVLLSDVPMVLVVRTFLLGLTAESAQLEQHFFRARTFAYDQPTRGEGHSTRYTVLRNVVDQLAADATFDDAARAEASLNRALFVFGRLNAEVKGVDLQKVRKERDDARRDAQVGLDYSMYFHDDPGRTEGAFYNGILGLMRAVIPLVQRSFQVLMDAAIADVEHRTPNHPALAKAKKVLATQIRPVLMEFENELLARQKAKGPGSDPSFGLDRPATMAIDITRSDFEHAQKRHLDYFNRTRQAPSVVITAYDVHEVSFDEKQLDVERTLQIRERQVAFLEQLAGVAVDKGGKVTAESAQNAALLAGIKQFSLHGNDGWRQFLLAKFKAAKAELKDDWKALSATVAVLRGYLNAFTIHTPYNIDEFGDNYLSRTFPRAMTGQLIHDCGVYALRVAYALSLVRDELKLTFRAAIMPVHIGLVISFGDDVTKGALYVNNNSIIEVDGTRLSQFAAQWQTRDERGNERAKPARLDARALHAEIVASTFAEGVDVPVRLVDVPRSPAGQAAAANKKALWDWYHDVNKAPAVRPVTGTPQPELFYLQYLRTLKNIHNQIRVPLYWAAHRLYQRDRLALESAARNLRSIDPRVKAQALGALRAHKAELEKLFEPLRKARSAALVEAGSVSSFMLSHPGAVGVGARLRSASRLNLSIDFEIEDYLGDGTTPGALESGSVMPAGWADQDRLPGRAD